MPTFNELDKKHEAAIKRMHNKLMLTTKDKNLYVITRALLLVLDDVVLGACERLMKDDDELEAFTSSAAEMITLHMETLTETLDKINVDGRPAIEALKRERQQGSAPQEQA